MTLEIKYAAVAMVFYGLADFAYKRAALAGVRADHFLVVQAWVFCPVVVIYAAVTHTLVFTWPALWGSLAGVFVFVGFYNFIESLKSGSVSTNAAVFRLNFIVTAALAMLFLGEPVTSTKLAGLALALVATWLLLGASMPRGATSDAAMQRSLVQVLVATLAFGAGTFFHTVGLRGGATPQTMISAQAILFTPLAMTFLYLVDRKVAPAREAWPYASLAAVLLVVAFLLLLTSLRGGEASVMVPIAQMGFVVTAIFGIVFLKEPFSARKAAGLAAAIGALAVLAVS